MSERPEQKVTSWLMDQCPTGWHMTRVENALGRGTPDLNICNNGHEWWMEVKAATFDKVRLRPEQWAWMQKRIEVGGGHCYVFCRDPKQKFLEWMLLDMKNARVKDPISGLLPVVPGKMYSGMNMQQLQSQINYLQQSWKPNR